MKKLRKLSKKHIFSKRQQDSTGHNQDNSVIYKCKQFINFSKIWLKDWLNLYQVS